jgi:ubiquinone/menaquinone biosynthesis C-methylase UbiE
VRYDASIAAGYGRGRRLRPVDIDRWMRAARPYLPTTGSCILDLGAGTGRFSAALAQAFEATVVACEPSPAMRAAWTGHHPRVHLVGGTAEAAPFRDNAFDAVWASQMVHHVSDMSAFATSVRRILKPAGYLLVRGGFSPADELPLFAYFPQAWAPQQRAALPLPKLINVLADHGLNLVERVTVEQTLADTADQLIDKVRTRSLSNLAELPDPLFEQGTRELEHAALAGKIDFPVTEHLDLVIFKTDLKPKDHEVSLEY